MKVITFVMLGISLGGCMITDREATFYTRTEIDAINARSQCKLLARNLVQVARCDNR